MKENLGKRRKHRWGFQLLAFFRSARCVFRQGGNLKETDSNDLDYNKYLNNLHPEVIGFKVK